MDAQPLKANSEFTTLIPVWSSATNNGTLGKTDIDHLNKIKTF